MVWREILAVLKANKKEAKSPKQERPHPPKLVCMCFTSTPTCMNFLRRFYLISIFSLPWTIVHGPKGKFGHFWRQTKSKNISKTGEVTSTKISLHAFHIHPYLYEFFEAILFDSIFSLPWTIVHGRKENLAIFESSNISETREVTPTKLVCMRFTSTPTCMNFLSQFYSI